MSVPTRAGSRPPAQRSPSGLRAARIMLYGYAAIALLMTQLPPLIPPTFPALHTPAWYAIAVLAGGLAALRTVLPRGYALGAGWLLLVVTVVQSFVVADLIAMFCTWLAVPALALLAGRIRVRARKALVAAHVVGSACWVGIAVVIVAMSVVAMTTREIETSLVTYELMALFDMTLLPWANFAATLSGIALAITTKWGLLTYRWVAAKLIIAIAILVMAFGFLHDALESAAAQAAHLAATGGSTAELTGVSDVVFWGFGSSLVSLAGALLLSLYKPGGRTRHGRRRAARTRTGGPAIPVTVAETREIAEGTVALTLRPSGGDALPGWQPGAHVDLVLPSGLVRQYSLYGDPEDTEAYRVAVLREPDGRGGSAEIHRLRTGVTIGIRGPRNNFPLVDAPSYLFIAGGIGITPFLPMIHRLQRTGADWRLIYRGHTSSSMAFAGALARQYPDRVRLLPADTHPRPDLDALLRGTSDGVAVYCCGPESLLRAVETAMPVHCPHGTLHTERFAASGRTDAGPAAPFEAELRRSGVLVQVPANRTLLSAIQDVDPTVDLSCEDGICGSCATRVLAGTPDHRDDVLQAGERDRTDVIYPCVSRAHGARIALDV